MEYVASPLKSSQLLWYVVEINFQQLRASEVGSSRDRRWDDKEVSLSLSYFPPQQPKLDIQVPLLIRYLQHNCPSAKPEFS